MFAGDMFALTRYALSCAQMGGGFYDSQRREHSSSDQILYLVAH